jgi:hypothetical protein
MTRGTNRYGARRTEMHDSAYESRLMRRPRPLHSSAHIPFFWVHSPTDLLASMPPLLRCPSLHPQRITGGLIPNHPLLPGGHRRQKAAARLSRSAHGRRSRALCECDAHTGRRSASDAPRRQTARSHAARRGRRAVSRVSDPTSRGDRGERKRGWYCEGPHTASNLYGVPISERHVVRDYKINT